MNLQEGNQINQIVRTFFEKGHKTCNKIYENGLAKTPIRSARRELSWHYRDRLPFSDSWYELAELLLKMKVSNRSGNCGEMAALSAYYAHNTKFVPLELIYLGLVTNPGDHAFCLIAPVAISGDPRYRKKYREFDRMEKFTKSGSAAAWLIIDPWLNVVCFADNYVTEAGSKLAKWQSDGKRVFWCGMNGKRPGWYNPSGDYEYGFELSDVELVDFKPR